MGRQELIKYLVEIALYGKKPICDFQMLSDYVDLAPENLRDILSEKGLKHTVNKVLNGGRGRIDLDPECFQRFTTKTLEELPAATANFRTRISYPSNGTPPLVRLNPNKLNLRKKSNQRHAGCDDLKENSVGGAIARRNEHERRQRRG